MERKSQQGTSPLKCYACGEIGHLGSQCPNAKAVAMYGTGAEMDGSAVRHFQGDLMTASDSLCHCVSEDLAMGKGIAVLFKQKFGRVEELRAQNIGVGDVAVLDMRPREDRFIYYLITKRKYSDKPTMETLAHAFRAMLKHMLENDVKTVSMPEIGCGLDGLHWNQVLDLIQQGVAGTDIKVSVYHFKPATQMWSRKGKYA